MLTTLLNFDLKSIVTLLQELGVFTGLGVIFVLGVLWFLFRRFEKNYDATLQGKQEEINRLSQENKEYRQIFINLMKENLNIKDFEVNEDEETLDISKQPEKKNRKTK